MPRIAIVVVSGSDNPGRAGVGLHVAQRIHEARAANGIESVEVFLFSRGVRLLGGDDPELAQLIRGLVADGVLVGGCRSQLDAWNLAETAKDQGVGAEFARDAFSRYAREGVTVLTF